MYCSQCGVTVRADAKFCQNCGRSIESGSQPEIALLKRDDSEPKPTPTSLTLTEVLGVNNLARLLLGGLVCFYALAVLPVFWGVEFNSKQYGATLLISSGSIFAYLWKKRKKTAGAGFAIGLLAGIVVLGTAGLIGGFIRASG